ncbi:hypothetical protein Ancab_039536 [Ancistrocladus abbreviatus]
MAMAQGKQASQTGSSSGGGNQSSTTCAAGKQEMLQIVTENHTKIQRDGSKIQRVPQILREIEKCKDSYEPLVISLGPYHHGKARLKRMEKLKNSMKQCFVDGIGEDEPTVYNKFLEVARDAKTDYYVLEPEDEKMDDGRLLQILFVDACFLIEFINAGAGSTENELGKMKNHDSAFVQRDIFLLENQLPFPIIEALMMLRFKEKEPYKMITQFVSKVIEIKPRPGSRKDWLMKLIVRKTEAYSSDLTHTDSKPVHLLHALQMQLVDVSKLTPKTRQEYVWYSYRSVSELKASGIHLKPGQKYSRFTDTNFESNIARGTLTLKPMVIDDSSKALLLNLCAF